VIDVEVLEDGLNFRLNQINSEVLAGLGEFLDAKVSAAIIVHNLEDTLKANEATNSTLY
jgi:hypothetical protein